jgi:hypothetical protein
VEPATTGAVGRQLQSALTKEVELVKHGELVAELVKLHQHDQRRESHRAVFRAQPRYRGPVWATAWPTPTCRSMSNSQLAVNAAWYMGVQVGLLQPMIGRKLRKAGVDRGTVDGHGVGITCSNTDGALRTCHSRVQHCIARESRRAGVHVMA